MKYCLIKSGIKHKISEILFKNGIKTYTSEILFKCRIKHDISEILFKSGIKNYTNEIYLDNEYFQFVFKFFYVGYLVH